MTLQEHYNNIKSGKGGNKTQFLKIARQLFPEYVNQYSDFDTATRVLKSKQIISEANAGGVVSKGFDIFDWKKLLAEEAKAEEKKVSKEVEDYSKNAYDNKDLKNADNINFNEIMKGFYCELKDEKNAGKTGDELKDIVVKNLAKDPLYYTKNGEFGVKDLGYTTEAPGLGTPKEPKGKHKSSGYGDLDTETEKVKANVQDSLGEREAKTSMPKKVKEMPVTPQNTSGVKKMKTPGTEKKIKLKENLENSTINQINIILDNHPELSQEQFDYEEGEYIGDENEYQEAFLNWLKNKTQLEESLESINEASIETDDLKLLSKDIYAIDKKIYISPKLAQSLESSFFNRGPASYERTQKDSNQAKTAYIKINQPFRSMLKKGLTNASTDNLPNIKNSDGTFKWIKLSFPEKDFDIITNTNKITINKKQSVQESKFRSLISQLVKEELNEYGLDSGGQDMTWGMYNRSTSKKDQGNQGFIKAGYNDYYEGIPFNTPPYEFGKNKYYGGADLAKLWQLGWKKAEAEEKGIEFIEDEDDNIEDWNDQTGDYDEANLSE